MPAPSPAGSSAVGTAACRGFGARPSDLEKKPHEIEVLEVIPGAIPYFELRKKLDAVLGSD